MSSSRNSCDYTRHTNCVTELANCSTQLFHVVGGPLGSALEVSGDDAARERATASDAEQKGTSRRKACVLHHRHV